MSCLRTLGRFLIVCCVVSACPQATGILAWCVLIVLGFLAISFLSFYVLKSHYKQKQHELEPGVFGPGQKVSLFHNRRASAGSNGSKLQVLSYNIYCIEKVRAPSDEQFLRFNSFVRDHMDNYDIIGLQEFFQPHEVISQDNLPKSKWYTLFSPETPWFVKPGVAIMSKYPIVGQDFTVWQDSVGSCFFTTRGPIFAKIDTPVKTTFVFTMHMQATFWENSFLEYWILQENLENAAKVRAKQFAQLEKWIPSVLARQGFDPEQHRLLVMGDFNVDSLCPIGVKEYYNVLEVMKRVGAAVGVTIKDLAGGERPVTFPAYKHEGKYESLDYIFGSEGGPMRAVDLKLGQDYLDQFSSKKMKKWGTLSDHVAVETHI